jgi:hypothetical protein
MMGRLVMLVRVCMSAVCSTATIIYPRPIAVPGAIPGAYSSPFLRRSAYGWPSRADTWRFTSVLPIVDGLGVVMRSYVKR